VADLNPKLAKCLARFAAQYRFGPLGPSQYELMRVLWDRSPATVRDLHRHFRTKGYRAIVKALGDLHAKGLVRRERESRFNAYTPTMSRQELETAIVSFLAPRD